MLDLLVTNGRVVTPNGTGAWEIAVQDGKIAAVATADWGYLRLRATGYADDDLRGWLATMQRIGGRWQDAFVFFKHEDQGTGPALGARLKALLD